jgi:hypothetical protein
MFQFSVSGRKAASTAIDVSCLHNMKKNYNEHANMSKIDYVRCGRASAGRVVGVSRTITKKKLGG